jgi:cytochrome c oxidase accessory protein FixG
MDDGPITSPAGTADALYAAHQKIYPREAHGLFARLRVAAVLVLLGVFYLLPWLRWEGRQAVLFDLPARKFYIFGLIFWPQDFFFLSWLLIIAALSLFFFTTLAGRLWCGYACPQTVWTEAFVWMERLAEGNRAQQIRLDRGLWTANKIARKTAKQAMWLGFSAWTGFTFVGYFTPIATLAHELVTLALGPWELFWCVFYGFATYGNAGYLREQVCKYMCPYARFQSAMFDRDTLIISYDPARGEPRGARQRGTDRRVRGLGDCIDCMLCVQVCPTGIDIRQGLQYECIACAACIDACDAVMDRMSYPRGLIRYATQSSMESGSAHILRPRMLVYGSLLVALVIGFGVAVAMRNPVDIDVLRDRNVLYRTLDDGTIENVYTVRLINKDEREHRFRLSASGLPGLQLDTDRAEALVGASTTQAVPIRLRLAGAAPRGSSVVRIHATAIDDRRLMAESTARFISP